MPRTANDHEQAAIDNYREDWRTYEREPANTRRDMRAQDARTTRKREAFGIRVAAIMAGNLRGGR